MIISSQGEACGPNEDIKALDLNGTKALRERLLEIQLSTAGGEEALLAGAEIELGVEQAEKEQEKLTKIEGAKQALQDFRDYLALSPGKAAQALPREEELVYNYNPETQECEITRQGGEDIELDLGQSNLQGELPLPPQLMVAKLYCNHNQLTALPVLPTSLTRLYCYNNQLTALPELPDNLTRLDTRSNSLTALPELPASLTEIDCGINDLIVLPELPDSLTKLFCDGNNLTTLPELSDSLSKIDCRGNQLTTLPELPSNLTELKCSENKLITLPELPASLTKLDCSTNQLITLPDLPDSMSILICNYNQLITLAKLPTSLSLLNCTMNPGIDNDPAAQVALQSMRDRTGTRVIS
jgi:hypothetical protein